MLIRGWEHATSTTEKGESGMQDPYERVRDDLIEEYGIKEGTRLLQMYINTAHARKKHVTGFKAFVKYVHEWEEACRRLKSSGADLSKIEIVVRG